MGNHIQNYLRHPTTSGFTPASVPLGSQCEPLTRSQPRLWYQLLERNVGPTREYDGLKHKTENQYDPKSLSMQWPKALINGMTIKAQGCIRAGMVDYGNFGPYFEVEPNMLLKQAELALAYWTTDSTPKTRAYEKMDGNGRGGSILFSCKSCVSFASMSMQSGIFQYFFYFWFF